MNDALAPEVIGHSTALRDVLQQVDAVAGTDSTVLICGESGTGKELVARVIHHRSARAGKPLVGVNCAALPWSLLESELFGHERGAFTGAIDRRIGRFELAGEGTLFLDEIGEMPLEVQPKLLRVLQEREFERLGSSRTQRSGARVIAATNRDLGGMIGQRTFREDLYYRLSVFPIRLPSLRERREDIRPLVECFVERLAQRMGKTIREIRPDTMARLERHDWPGNIRELQNVIERALILARGPVLEIPCLPVLPAAIGTAVASVDSLEHVDRAHILAVLRATNWVVGGPNGAAARLGIKRSTLNFRMKKLGIERPSQALA